MKLAHRFVQVLTAAVLTASATLSGTGVSQPVVALQDLSASVLDHGHLPAHTASWQQVFATAGR